MANRSKARGTAFETAVVDFLRAHGHPLVERRALRGVRDCGDLVGLIGWTVELKNCARMELAEWMKQAQREAINDGGYRHAVIHKQRGKNIRDAYVTVPLWLFAELLADELGARAAS
jgi:hypothetical protein